MGRWGDAMRSRGVQVGLPTQSALASALGVDVRTVVRWQTWDGYRPMRHGHAQAMCETLGLRSVDELQRLPDLMESGELEGRSARGVLRFVEPADVPVSVVVSAMRAHGARESTLAAFLDDVARASQRAPRTAGGSR